MFTTGGGLSLITGMSDTVTSMMGWFGSVLGLFTNNPVLIIVFAIFVVSAVIGLVTRLSNAR